jgi:hypothetical protein
LSPRADVLVQKESGRHAAPAARPGRFWKIMEKSVIGIASALSVRMESSERQEIAPDQ